MLEMLSYNYNSIAIVIFLVLLFILFLQYAYQKARHSGFMPDKDQDRGMVADVVHEIISGPSEHVAWFYKAIFVLAVSVALNIVIRGKIPTISTSSTSNAPSTQTTVPDKVVIDKK